MGKKNKGNKKKQSKETKDTLPEVDKEYYEIQIADLNKKLTRLKDCVAQLETDNEKLKIEIQTLDTDRADVIAYLKRKLGEKMEEISETSDRNKAMMQQKEADTKEFNDTLNERDQSYKDMHDQLTSEIKLLTGKLNALEEYRVHREELLQKFTKQQTKMEEQEKQHKTAIYEAEKNFLISKDKLRQEMEEKLLQLSLDFQKATQTRIASTTQNVIRENITINNELSLLIASWQKLFDENEELKEKIKQLKIELETETEQKNEIIKRNVLQTQAINRLTFNHGKAVEMYAEMEQCHLKVQTLQDELDKCKKGKENAEIILKSQHQKTDLMKYKNKEQESELTTLKNIVHHYEITAKKAILLIKHGLRLRDRRAEEAITAEQEYNFKENVLLNLDKLFDHHYFYDTYAPTLTEASVDTLINPEPGESSEYKLGMLGLIPKTVQKQSVEQYTEI